MAYHFPYLLRGGEPRPHSRQLLALCFLGIAARPLLGPTEFRTLLLALSMIGCAAWGKFDCLGIFGFAALVIAISRSKLPVLLRVAAVMLLWFAALVPKLWLERAEILPHVPLFVYWAGIPFSAVYLVVDRARGSLDGNSWVDDALYLLALPRFVSPFIQTISPATFLRSQTEQEPDLRLALRGAALTLYGSALYVLMAKFPYIHPPRPDVHPDPQWAHTLRGPHNLVFIYAVNASAIFCAVGLFRLLGFDLPSGFRWPLLSKSFAEFYRRFNHYVYDTIKSLFLFPLLGWLRTILPGALAAGIAGYLAIFLGSYCLNMVLVPLALDPNPRMVLARAFDPAQLLILGVFWSLIILPQLLPRRAQVTRPTPMGGVLKRLVFVAILLLVAHAAANLGVVLM